jgi:hypothetical protein
MQNRPYNMKRQTAAVISGHRTTKISRTAGNNWPALVTQHTTLK